ncbi:hypothetical protein ACFFX1_26230 [Dactylosporangium sucinum]|uniref:Uncharacterized protein n=1 Tax=Dactylosporangium sucinum TaxID=1424081 RepID=A0A917WI39_9ACTN|nr:hypothetical protein [Dactylosporangium sucinum]GGM04957.1 hypothetical protein GCM10007977_002640 [Dactylosporangium sucinum]
MSLETQKPAQPVPDRRPGPVRLHRPLLFVAAVTAAGFLFTLAGLVADDRTLGGAPVWLKPMKFTLSFGIYAITLAWLLPRFRKGRRVAWWAGTALAAALLAELGAISFQAARGHYSHFNTMTPVDAQVIQVMTVGVLALYLGNLILIVVLLLRDHALEPELRWAFRFGLLIAFAGMVEGFFMNVPTAAQKAAAQAGQPTLIGAHTVGVPDGGPGLPVTGWSTIGGDLRIPHFLAMHALQLLPLVALALRALSRRRPALGATATRVRLVLVAAGGYAGIVALTTWQAYRAQPLFRPDATTLAALAALVVLVAAAALIVVSAGRSADRRI